MVNPNITTLALAGLLHDIGKFALRANVGATRTWDDEARREYKYKHALLSADFVERFVPAQWHPTVLSAVAYHHKPTQTGDRIVMLADWLAAAERSQGDDDSDRKVHPQQLRAIFCSVKTKDVAGNEQSAELAYLPLRPLALQRDVLFPQRDPLPASDVWRAYDTLWQQFTAHAQKLHNAHTGEAGDIATYLTQLQLLLQRYAWCMPSAYFRATPDISLYDHSRMTAALSAALAKQQPDDAWLQRVAKQPERSTEAVALLVGGDISGIQSFIYTITARGATPALRGRSFYLQMLTEAVARYVLRRLDLPLTNLIYAGGGSFYLLAAAGDREQIQQIQQEIGRKLLHHHQGDLYVALAVQTLVARTFFNGEIASSWEKLHHDFSADKARRFAELGDDIQTLFSVAPLGGDSSKVCSVCGSEHPDTNVTDTRDTGDGPTKKCPRCEAFEKLGDDLRRADRLVMREVALPTARLSADSYADCLAEFGLAIELGQRDLDVRPVAERHIIYSLSDSVTLPDAKPNRAVGRRFFVNVTPTITSEELDRLHRDESYNDDLPKNANSVKPFSVMAHQSRGIKRLGVLRMDVDNLGAIFSKGLGDNATLSRMAALSFSVSLYFEGWVEQLASQLHVATGVPDDRLYSIYSGGDDLFFVGAWDAVVELARVIRADLTPYVAHHPGITASAGIALVTQKYPLYQAARDAGSAEHSAKAHEWWVNGQQGRKDAINFLGRTLPWRRFGLDDTAGSFETSVAMMRFLTQLAQPGPLVRRLSYFDAAYRELERKRAAAGRDRNQQGEPQPLWGPYIYRAVYDLARMANRYGQDKDDINRLREQLKQDNFQNLIWIGLAARWADLYLRR